MSSFCVCLISEESNSWMFVLAPLFLWNSIPAHFSHTTSSCQNGTEQGHIWGLQAPWPRGCSFRIPAASVCSSTIHLFWPHLYFPITNFFFFFKVILGPCWPMFLEHGLYSSLSKSPSPERSLSNSPSPESFSVPPPLSMFAGTAQHHRTPHGASGICLAPVDSEMVQFSTPTTDANVVPVQKGASQQPLYVPFWWGQCL